MSSLSLSVSSVVSTFFMFWLYAAPAARMSALQGLRVIGIATHDSIGTGEDGPTHQPIALPAFYRSLPNFNYFRPADGEEVVGCYALALDEENASTPSLLSLSRQAVPLLEGSDRTKVRKGAYIIYSSSPESASKPDLTLISTGSEVWRAIEAAKKLSATIKSINVVSMPIQEVFDKQDRAYRQSIIPSSTPTVAIEPYASDRWARYAHASINMVNFGWSAPGDDIYEFFGFGVDSLAATVGKWYGGLGGQIPLVGEFEELVGDLRPHFH